MIKLLPFAVMVKALLPAAAVAGLMDVNTGTGLLTTTLLMVKVSAPLEPPPGAGLNTVIAAEPAVAILAAARQGRLAIGRPTWPDARR